MNANDARQVVCRRKRKRRFFEQNFHRALLEKMKKHVKRILNKKSTQNAKR